MTTAKPVTDEFRSSSHESLETVCALTGDAAANKTTHDKTSRRSVVMTGCAGHARTHPGYGDDRRVAKLFWCARTAACRFSEGQRCCAATRYACPEASCRGA